MISLKSSKVLLASMELMSWFYIKFTWVEKRHLALSGVFPKYKHCVKSVQNPELFLVPVFPHSDWIQRDILYFSVFSPNAGKYRPEITPYYDTFHAREQLILCEQEELMEFSEQEVFCSFCLVLTQIGK